MRRGGVDDVWSPCVHAASRRMDLAGLNGIRGHTRLKPTAGGNYAQGAGANLEMWNFQIAALTQEDWWEYGLREMSYDRRTCLRG